MTLLTAQPPAAADQAATAGPRHAHAHRETKDAITITMTTKIEANALDKALRTLKLSGMLDTIEARLAQARAGELGHIEFLQVLC